MKVINEWENQDSVYFAHYLLGFPMFFSISWFQRELADGTQLTRSMDSHGVNLAKQQLKDASVLVQISDIQATVISMTGSHSQDFADSRSPPPGQKLLHLGLHQWTRQWDICSQCLNASLPQTLLEASFVLLPGQMHKGLLIMNRALSALLNTEGLGRCAVL